MADKKENNLSNAPLEHLFNDHTYCSSEWCPIKSGKKNVEKFKYKDKEKDKETYELMRKIWDTFTCKDRLRECWHIFDSQTNEAMNFAVSRRAPKSRTYATTLSLQNRVMITVGEHNVGVLQYWTQIFESMNITVGSSLRQFLVKHSNELQRRNSYKKKSYHEKKKSRGKK